MELVNNTIEQIQGVLTLLLAIVTLVAVCGPLNHRKFCERAFLFSLAISLVGAAMKRGAKKWGAYDYDGSMMFLAEAILIVARCHAIAFGVIMVSLWTCKCKAREARNVSRQIAH